MPKVKVKQIKKIVGDVDINGMFEEMMGVRDAEAEIIVPKMVEVRNILRHLYRLLTQFSTFTDLRNNFHEIAVGLDDIKQFANDMKDSTCITEEEDTVDRYTTLSQETVNNLYRKIKDDKYVKALIILCNKLDKYKVNFADSNSFKENFVNQEPGLTFRIFDFSSLDLKLLWAHDNMKLSVKKYILMVLSRLHSRSYDLYRVITSPDVDIEKFTGLLISSIAELKKQPGLSRCKSAFARIEKSVELLKDKFSDYYRESIASENPNSLVTSFITDVSNQGGANANLTREFREIITYMTKVSQQTGKNKDPNVQKIMKMLNHNYSLMEKHTIGKTDTKDDTKDISSIDLTLKTDVMSAAEIAEEKQLKRKEKQRAKNKKKKSKDKKHREAVTRKYTTQDDQEEENIDHNDETKDQVEEVEEVEEVEVYDVDQENEQEDNKRFICGDDVDETKEDEQVDEVKSVPKWKVHTSYKKHCSADKIDNFSYYIYSHEQAMYPHEHDIINQDEQVDEEQLDAEEAQDEEQVEEQLDDEEEQVEVQENYNTDTNTWQPIYDTKGNYYADEYDEVVFEENKSVNTYDDYTDSIEENDRYNTTRNDKSDDATTYIRRSKKTKKH